MPATGEGRRVLWLGLLVVWSALIAVGITVMYTGLRKAGYFEPTEEALELARVGKLQIYAGSAALVVAAGWARMMLTPIWACILVASPAVLVGGLTLAIDNSLLPHLAALVTFPMAVAGLISGLILARPLGRVNSAPPRSPAEAAESG
ncbi:hypothetical protein E3N86_04470 [Cryobacterium sp. Hz7]|uniref:hypothetical protein n=1 Tax=unclassified Cryobacterium TaxID=2649013 RepID=UPI00106AD94E|nr:MULTISPECIES: hypothetical protein [unclassified Cryobacterium]TFB63584.1 hypothetical protein E3N86_04470 [Cryobacterium sp. Hz7]TFC65008.1 hypothetical protein E3O54_14245 [Cryobacterium sp. TMT2-4]